MPARKAVRKKPASPSRRRTKSSRDEEAGLDSLVGSIRKNKDAVVHVEEIPARPAVYGDGGSNIPAPLRAALGSSFQLFSHQRQAIAAALNQENVVIATSTSSGKSMCYNIPVLANAIANPRSTALYLFPTRALAQDQLRALNELIPKTGADIMAAQFDSDTPDGLRRAIKTEQRANILIVTPDMLHKSLLAWHYQWSWLFNRLRYVVVDEVHTYRGIFGSHVANVFRRLHRVADFYGGKPQYVCCSATIANAREFAERLCGEKFTLVDQDGSPQGPRTVLFWNPPFLAGHAAEGKRDKAFVHSARLLTEHVKRDVRTIDFTRSRKLTERIFRGAHRDLQRDAPGLADRISPYRAGYLAQERRDIERRLFSGELLGVVATNALELGIDVGHLDAAIITGFPGTVASFWQQAGRAGRSGKRAAITFVADDDALNQYWMTNPKEFFARSHERAIINPDNPYVLDAHVACAIKEVPGGDHRGAFGPAFDDSAARLVARGIIQERGDRWAYTGPPSPQYSMSIRSITNRTYALLGPNGRPIGEPMEETRVFKDLHPGAVYYHLGESYLVDDLDLDKRIVHLTQQDVDYRTEPQSSIDIEIMNRERTRTAGAVDVQYGALRVTEQVTGFARVDDRGDTIETEDVELPQTTLETKGLWYELNAEQRDELVSSGFDLTGCVHAAEHAMIGLTPLIAMCDRWDLGGVSYPAYPESELPTVFLYDGYPGGVGITEADFENFDEIAGMTLKLLRECPCEEGCPGCVQSPKCGNRNEHLDKRGAARVLEFLTAREKSTDVPAKPPPKAPGGSARPSGRRRT